MQILQWSWRIGLVWFTLHSLFIIIDGLTGTNVKADAAIVMGSQVNEDGTLSSRLQARVDCAYDLYKEGRVKQILVSGGRGSEGYQEAEVMKTYLLGKGVPDEAIVTDNMGSNTSATVKNAIQPSRQYNWQSIIVVSQYWHVTRAKMFFRKEGFKNVYGDSPIYFEFRDFYSIFREFWAFYIGLFA